MARHVLTGTDTASGYAIAPVTAAQYPGIQTETMVAGSVNQIEGGFNEYSGRIVDWVCTLGCYGQLADRQKSGEEGHPS